MKNYILYFALILFCSELYAQWEPDRKLSTGEVNALTNENMGQCIAKNGNVVHVVWSDVIDGSGIYYKRSTDAGVTWGPDTRLTATPSISDFPSIAVSGNYVHVAYRDSTLGVRTSNYIRSTDGGNTWEAPVSLGSYYWWPSITASGSGVYVALNSNSHGNSEVWCRRSSNNGTNWGSVVQISNAIDRSENPSIATGGNCLHLAWNDNRTDTMQTFYRFSTDLGVTWGPEIQRTHTTVFAYSPVLSVSAGDVDLVWSDKRNGGEYEIYHLHSTDFGSTWGVEERLSFDLSGSLYPNLIRSGLNVHVIWTGNGLFYLHSSDGGTTWDSPVTLVSASSQPIMSFISVTGNVVHIIWSDNRDGHRAIYYKRNPTGNAAPPSNFITVTSAPSQLCTGTSFPLEYEATGMFFDDNVFTAQLSDGMGRFSNPIDIGFVNSTSSGEINATIPSNVTPASGYRIRVNSSSPAATGTENDFDISLNNHPTPSIQGISVVCQNSSQTFSTPFTASHSYKWSVVGGNISGLDTQRTITVNWNTSNTFGTVSLKETIITTGCFDTVSKKITLIPLPTPNIQGPTISCRNNLQTFSTDTATGHSYKWTVDGGILIGPDDSSSIKVNWATSGTSGTITVIETVDAIGCTGTDKHYVEIISVPRPFITGPNNTCNKSPQDYSTLLDYGHSCIWRIEGGSIVGANNQNAVLVNWNSSNTFGTVYLNETIDSTGCTDSTTMKVTLNPVPIVTITGPITVKKGSTQNYSGPSPGIAIYKWHVTGGIIFGADNLQAVSIKWGTQRTGTLKLICTNSSACSDSLQKSISIGNSSIVLTGSEAVCEQSTTEYSTPFISGRSDEWTAIGGTIEGSSTDTTIQILWGNKGNGRVALIQTIDANQLKDTATLDIIINPMPHSIITGKDTVIKGRMYTYYANFTDGTYQWETINGTINGSATDRFVDIIWESEDNGNVKLIETNKEGCTDSASLDLKLIIVSVQENSSFGNLLLKIIPNPMNGKAKIEITANGATNANIQIVNSYGNVINEFGNIILNEGKQYIDWNGSGVNGESIPSGIYFIKLSSKYGVTVAKAVVLR